MNRNLADFLLKKQKPAAGVDWDERRNTYLAAVNDLYSRIASFLADPIRRKTVALQRRPKTLSESYIGTYSIDDLIVVVGDEQVRFSPRGRNILGAAGRVDVVGERGEAALVVGYDSNWGLLQARQPTPPVAPFDEPTLTEVLETVMRD